MCNEKGTIDIEITFFSVSPSKKAPNFYNRLEEVSQLDHKVFRLNQ